MKKTMSIETLARSLKIHHGRLERAERRRAALDLEIVVERHEVAELMEKLQRAEKGAA